MKKMDDILFERACIPGQQKHRSGKKENFTLIELLVLTAQHCCHFISNVCTVPSPNTPLFFESERGFGGKRKPSFLVKRKFSLSSKLSPFTLIELLVLTAQYCRNHVKVLYDRIGMQAAGAARWLGIL